MTALKRILVVLAANGFLLALVITINLYLSGLAFHVFVPALVLVYPSLYLPPRHGWIPILVTAAAIEATLPVKTGAFVALSTVAALILEHYRQRLRSESLGYATGTTIAINLGFLLTLTLVLPTPDTLRVLTDLIASSILIAIATSWFFSLQHASLAWLQVRPHPDEF